MKHLNPTIYILSFVLIGFTAFGQDSESADSTGLLGDNFSLEGALQVFKESKNLEDFEKSLNDADQYVNNLDLNDDGDVDYIRVIDQMQEDAHAIVLQVPISESESQDIAVIQIEKTGSESAVLQILGDEDLYGPDHLIEPVEEVASGGKGGPDAEYEISRIVVNVWFWPSIRYIYAPGYRVYVSPWRYRYYPVWWSPWRPHPWRHYHVHRSHYRVGFSYSTTHRVVRAHNVYRPVRRSSPVVKTKSTRTVAVSKAGNKNKGVVSKTKTTQRAGTSVSATKTTVAAKNGNKSAKASKTTVAAKKGDKTAKASKSTVAAKSGNKSAKTTVKKGKATNGTKAKGKKVTKTTKKSGGKKSTTTKKKVKKKKNG